MRIADCEDLSVEAMNFYTDSSSSYTCNNCFFIELGPYQYLYGLTRMRQVNIVTKCCNVSHTPLSAIFC